MPLDEPPPLGGRVSVYGRRATVGVPVDAPTSHPPREPAIWVNYDELYQPAVWYLMQYDGPPVPYQPPLCRGVWAYLSEPSLSLLPSNHQPDHQSVDQPDQEV